MSWCVFVSYIIRVKSQSFTGINNTRQFKIHSKKMRSFGVINHPLYFHIQWEFSLTMKRCYSFRLDNEMKIVGSKNSKILSHKKSNWSRFNLSTCNSLRKEIWCKLHSSGVVKKQISLTTIWWTRFLAIQHTRSERSFCLL